MTDKVMMHTGPTLFNEAIYDALWECEDVDCGEYILLSGRVFGDKATGYKNYCETEEARLFYKDLSCGLDPKTDYDIGTLYGGDPLWNGWGWSFTSFYIYNDFCYNLTS
jgi:hypothetical protein